MEKSFKFIDATKNDKLTRRLARNHALKGKNTGKTLYRRSKLEQGQLHTYRRFTLTPIVESQIGQRSSGAAIHGSPGLTNHTLSNDILSASFAFEVSPHNQRIINQCRCFAIQSGQY